MSPTGYIQTLYDDVKRYLQPEKIAKSKRLISVMEQLATSGRLGKLFDG